eukprot:4515989-Pleurochrysis_carterae.AAC.1
MQCFDLKYDPADMEEKTPHKERAKQVRIDLSGRLRVLSDSITSEGGTAGSFINLSRHVMNKLGGGAYKG